MTFEWQQVFRFIYTNGTRPRPAAILDGRFARPWDGDTFVVDVTNHNDRTWFDMAGNFHSDALHVCERYTMLDADTIRYQATIDDPKVFTRPWTITVPLARQKEMRARARISVPGGDGGGEGEFKPDRARGTRRDAPQLPRSHRTAPTQRTTRRARSATPDGKPDISGFTEADAGGANWGFEPHNEPFTPGGRGVLVDPKTGGLPYQPWARAEKQDRTTPGARLRRSDRALFRRRRSASRSMCLRPFYIIQTPGMS
jgi:hypothetical protein